MKPRWLIEIEEKARPAMAAFKGSSPEAFLFAQDDEQFFDGQSLFEIQVFNTTARWSVAQDAECPLMPIWRGEVTATQERMIREFQLRYAQTGDF